MCQKKRIASTAQVALTLLTCSRSDLVGCLVAQLLLRVCVLNSSMSLWCFQVKGKCSQLLFLNYGHSSLSDGNRWVEMHKSRNLYLHVGSQCWSTGGIKCTWHGAPSCHANCRTSLHSRLYKVLIDNRTALFWHIQSAAFSQIVCFEKHAKGEVVFDWQILYHSFSLPPFHPLTSQMHNSTSQKLENLRL
jgi:hypothetical protein